MGEEGRFDLDLAYFLDKEGYAYKITPGHSGDQINLRECLWCGNSKWKIYANAESGSGKCFVCDQTFSAYRFIGQALNLSGSRLRAYADKLREEMGYRPKLRRRLDVSAGSFELPACVPAFEHPDSLEYLSARGVSREYAEYFGLRYCHSGGYRATRNGEEFIQPYDRRIVIPIHDADGVMVNFQGRDITGTSDRKYLFPPGLPGTGRFLYNANNHRDEPVLVLCEGVFDAVGVKMALDRDPAASAAVPVATFGKNFSLKGDQCQYVELAKLRKQGARRVVFMWDGERQAACAALEAGLKLACYGYEAYLALLPRDKDPNEASWDEVCRAYHASQAVTTRSYLLLQRRINQLYGG